jgi:hypothetical protein
MAQQVSNYATENDIDLAVVKASAVSLGGTKKAHLESAELRGVVMMALGSVTNVECKSKAVISKTFGTRKVDSYVKDDGFWLKEWTKSNLQTAANAEKNKKLQAHRLLARLGITDNGRR